MEGAIVEQRQLFRRGRIICGLSTVFFHLSTLCCFVGAVVSPTDLSALNALSSAWGANTLGWTAGGDPCVNAWQGVVCDATNTQVKALLLTSGSIVGTIPAAIGSFSGLEQLDLSYNAQLRGVIPSEIGQLTTLKSLIIQACALTGSIPTTLSNLKSLTFLALNNNQLTGAIPSSIGSLQNVTWFDFSNNNMTGPLPVSTTSADGFGLDTMASCEHFHLNNNSFTGGIPSELGAPRDGVVKLTKLIHLLLEGNQLSGSIPDSLANLTSLEIVSLSNNQLSGPIPASLNRLATVNRTLHQLLVGNNRLTGTIPDLTLVAGGLQVVDFSYNSFNPQPFPAWLQMATNLQTVYLEHSNLAGNFSEEIFAYPSLQTLWARNNSLNGTLIIPSSIGSNLSVITLDNNQIDNLFMRNPNLNMSSVELKLAGNPVCAPNYFFRPASACDGLNEAKAAWTYSPPGNTCNNQTCSGSLTPNLQNVGNCRCVEPFEVLLECRRPTFSVITDALMEKLRGYMYVQLSLLPVQVLVESASFTSDGRAEIRIYFFNADGVSPLDRNTMTNITHSLALQKLSLPEFKPYIAQHVVNGATLLNSKKGLGAGAISGIAVGILAVVSVIGVYAVWQKRRAQRMEHMAQPFANWGGVGGEKDVAAPQIAGARWFSFAEVKKATNNFAAENEIGEGGYGKVYAGVLASGERVAVKRAQEDSMQGAEEFKNEIELLSRVHHKNLVGLVGYCYDQGEQMLVYEFMANGTMREWLSGKHAYPLDWSKRLSIAIGSARGLTYLHEMANPPIIHRDIKSSNILLSETHIAKVADFGLSKVAPDGGDKRVTTTQVKGTLGYLDPEYYMTNQLSEKSDVYSYGVVLLELLTSRQPLSHGKFIVREVQNAYAEGDLESLEPLLDPCMHEASPQDLQRMVELALMCVEERGGDRPTMNEVVKVLEGFAQHNKAKAKGSALATDETWLHDVYGDDAYSYSSESHVNAAVSSSFLYSGGYTPQNPVPK